MFSSCCTGKKEEYRDGAELGGKMFLIANARINALTWKWMDFPKFFCSPHIKTNIYNTCLYLCSHSTLPCQGHFYFDFFFTYFCAAAFLLIANAL